MRHFWALPAVFRVALVLAAHRAFSVNDDLLAYPQFKVQWLEDYVSDTFADSKLRRNKDASQITPEDSESHVQQYVPPPITETGHPDSFRKSSKDGDDDYEYELMVLHGQRFLCAIPRVVVTTDNDGSSSNSAANDTTLAQQREEEAKELARASERGWELLSGMQGNCVYYISGWWSYSFCFKQGVRQFHALPAGRGMPAWPPQEDPGVEGFMLGTYGDGASMNKPPSENGVSTTREHKTSKGSEGRTGELITTGESRYLVQRLEGGTICDLTGKGRRIEVQFHCNPSMGVDRISLIKELSTCSYLMVIQTPRLCNDVAFLPPQQEIPNDIICQPVLKPDEVEIYLEDLATIKEALKQSEDWVVETAKKSDADGSENDNGDSEALGSDNIVLQLIGDVIVGGRNILPDDLELEKSAIVGGNKQTYVDTVASSDGTTMSKADMEKLGYGDKRTVDKLMKEIEQMAKGRPWKLDVVETPRGREYIGYIDEKEEERLNKAAKEAEEEGSVAADGAADAEDNEEDGSQEEYFFKEEL